MTGRRAAAAEAVGGLVLLFVAMRTHRSDVFAWQMAGSFVGLLGLWLLWRGAAELRGLVPRTVTVAGRTLEPGLLARRLLPPLAVVALAVLLLRDLIGGGMPISHDHPVHLYKAWHFWDEMLLQGRLRGWSSYWFFGYPAEELYPIGPDLWVALFRALTFGLLSWEATYSLSFIGVFAFSGWAVYVFGRRYFGITAGLIAAFLWLLDPGAYREGGWSYTVDWAVWVQILAMAFLLLALAKLEDVLERGRPGDWAAAGLLLGAALLSHQMNVLLLGLGLPLFVLARVTAGNRPLGQEAARAGGALGLGVLVAGFWLLPMLARKGWTTNIGDLWNPIESTALGLVDGNVFGGVWPAAVLAGLAGAAIGVARRRWVVVFLATLSGALIFAATSTAFHDLDLFSISSAFGKLQYQRLLIPAKVGLFLLAGYAVRVALDAARERRGPPPLPRRGRTLRALGLAVLVAAALAPFVRPMLSQLKEHHLKGVGALEVDLDRQDHEDYERFIAWSREVWDESPVFYRIAYELDYHDHTMMAAPVHNHTPYYKIGYTPAKLFKHAPEESGAGLYEALSVKYVVTRRAKRGADWDEAARFGRLGVYRFKGFDADRWSLDGPGEVDAQEFGEERIHLALSGIEPGTRLTLHVANHPRWRVRMNGETQAANEVPAVPGGPPMLMEIPVEDGDLVVEYVARAPDILGWVATLLGLILCALLLVRARRPAWATRLAAAQAAPARWIVGLAPWTVAAGALLVVAFLGLRLHGASYGGMDDDHLAAHLPEAEITLAGKPCDDRQEDRWYCSDKKWNYVGRTVQRFDGAFQPCVWAHPSEKGPLEIRIPAVRLGAAITGHHGIADSGRSQGHRGGPVEVELLADGARLDRLTVREQQGWSEMSVDTGGLAGEEVELLLRITAKKAGRRHFCFDYRIER
ncbi:MAG: 6-pyruvoyl-tetrahydropterin synthase-related protein [Pseudomonadota bacterium]